MTSRRPVVNDPNSLRPRLASPSWGLVSFGLRFQCDRVSHSPECARISCIQDAVSRLFITRRGAYLGDADQVHNGVKHGISISKMEIKQSVCVCGGGGTSCIFSYMYNCIKVSPGCCRRRRRREDRPLERDTALYRLDDSVMMRAYTVDAS